MRFGPCYTEEKIREIAGSKTEWTALDVLALDIPAADRLWAVLRKEFIPAHILHEFACRVAEEALSKIESPDPRSLAVIETKRAWVRGEATDGDLRDAKAAAQAALDDAQSYAAARPTRGAWLAAWAATSAAHLAAWAATSVAHVAAYTVAWDAANTAGCDAAWTGCATSWVAACNAACDAAWENHAELLRGMLV
jgi:hypothetical protein